MANSADNKQRRIPWIMGSFVLLAFTFLVLMQSSNLWKTLGIETASDTLLLYALSALNFFALVIFGFILLRSIFKLLRERRALKLGSQLKTRLMLYFFAISLLPIVAMAIFSYLFMNRALDRWFTNIPETVIQEARRVQSRSLLDRTEKLDETARMLAVALAGHNASTEDLKKIAEDGKLSYIEVMSKDRRTIAKYQREVEGSSLGELTEIIAAIHIGEIGKESFRDGRGYDVATAALSDGRTLVLVPDPFSEESVSQIVDNSLNEFDDLKSKQVTVRQVGLGTLGVLTFMLIFASSWVALYIARGLTVPIQALAGGAKRLADGEMGHQIDVPAEDELALLVGAFNEMSAKLDASNNELVDGRRYIETVISSLPNGVISLDRETRIRTINRAAANILDLEDGDFTGMNLDTIAHGENLSNLEHVISRARRTGRATDQIVIKREPSENGGAANPDLTTALTATALQSGGGVVVVIEDLSELISAQRASAWQEVARRMAHEIKNPLTPIQLSAERIARRFNRTEHRENGLGKRLEDGGPITNVVEESTQTILREVTSLKTMVDEFSRFARLPDVMLESGDINEVASNAVSMYDGRFPDIVIESELGSSIPQIMIDREQLSRVFVNLIENAAEAFTTDQGDKRITISTRHDPARELVIAEISDNGPGIDPADLQKLFQPYFSTKGRGTGLGLAIVQRIVSEHKGRIIAGLRHPNGSKFVIEMPTIN